MNGNAKSTLVVEIKSFSITRLKLHRWRGDELDYRQLKSKVSRLRDWNWSQRASLKQLLSLKSKVSRLRDWNTTIAGSVNVIVRGWNQKFLDYEIETLRDESNRQYIIWSWNQKFLDYEIETCHAGRYLHISPYPGWNQKFLDYEIETVRRQLQTSSACRLKSKVSRLRDWNAGNDDPQTHQRRVEIKSFSITRLKRETPPVKTKLLKPVEIKSFSITRLKPCSRKSEAFGFSFSWNQKFLDYEIETGFFCRNINISRLLELKSKVSRLRDWNDEILCEWEFDMRWLKSKVSRLRDWNIRSGFHFPLSIFSWNQKFLDYEIETKSCCRVRVVREMRWNQKFLDYEIETRQPLLSSPSPSWVEIKSFSITRLKPSRLFSLQRFSCSWNQKFLDYEIETRHAFDFLVEPLESWNQKFLDYEIETWCFLSLIDDNLKLKSKVSRLRDWNFSMSAVVSLALPAGLKSKVSRLRDWNINNSRLGYRSPLSWNQKFLDYEIETWHAACCESLDRLGWNQKFLDYEIETMDGSSMQIKSSTPLKSKVSRLRDWNTWFGIASTTGWSWNQKFLDYEIETEVAISRSRFHEIVEIKSFSITRLKLGSDCVAGNDDPRWNQKFLDYEIETGLASTICILTLFRWNQKFLDYEIETTAQKGIYVRFSVDVEIKSFSITRLKRSWFCPGWSCSTSGWNQKFLDYEIETIYQPDSTFHFSPAVEIKSFSITRLKRPANRFSARTSQQLKSKVSRLRDWNWNHKQTGNFTTARLKSKVSRLRDWNEA